MIECDTLFTISSEKLDDIYLINREHSFRYPPSLTNQFISEKILRTVIIIQNEKFHILGTPNDHWYDHLYFDEGRIRIVRNGLQGYYYINLEPKYLRADSFEFYLSRFKLPNGPEGYLDLFGNEFLDNNY